MTFQPTADQLAYAAATARTATAKPARWVVGEAVKGFTVVDVMGARAVAQKGGAFLPVERSLDGDLTVISRGAKPCDSRAVATAIVRGEAV